MSERIGVHDLAAYTESSDAGRTHMQIITRSTLAGNLDEYLDNATRQAIEVESPHHSKLVLLPHAEYERLKEVEDAYWAICAEKAMENGLASPEEVQRLLTERANEAA
ncbi:hypothetical protein [Massilia sp. YIM B04103]|uniref:hypothetical protein n=1 Tax=Massilia sp. YIM B04103 TaxID=2963106 RepID=UPI002109CF47|nr:hypothetical protein [Massilia sp. YIM B04103]